MWKHVLIVLHCIFCNSVSNSTEIGNAAWISLYLYEFPCLYLDYFNQNFISQISEEKRCFPPTDSLFFLLKYFLFANQMSDHNFVWPVNTYQLQWIAVTKKWNHGCRFRNLDRCLYLSTESSFILLKCCL